MNKTVVTIDKNGTPKYKYCLRCGRVLKREEYETLGYGPVCLKKLSDGIAVPPLFEIISN